eukprot:scaffold499091_cov15-Prasinocladus_malaysianus.AAC.3
MSRRLWKRLCIDFQISPANSWQGPRPMSNPYSFLAVQESIIPTGFTVQIDNVCRPQHNL